MKERTITEQIERCSNLVNRLYFDELKAFMRLETEFKRLRQEMLLLKQLTDREKKIDARLDAEPTVEAIPIEWIEEWQNKHEWEYESYFAMRDGKPKYAIECMIEDWEKANETD